MKFLFFFALVAGACAAVHRPAVDDDHSANVAAIIRPHPLPPHPSDIGQEMPLPIPDEIHVGSTLPEIEHGAGIEDMHKPAQIPAEIPHIITSSSGVPLVQIIVNVASPVETPVVAVPESHPENPIEMPIAELPQVEEEFPVGTFPIQPEEFPVGTFPIKPEELPVGTFPLEEGEHATDNFPLEEQVPEISHKPQEDLHKPAVDDFMHRPAIIY